MAFLLHLFLALVAFSTRAMAFFRMPCQLLVQERADPLMSPGTIAAHKHGIFGGSAFNVNRPTHDQIRASKCTTCSVNEDKSLYWTPNLFFQYKNGSFVDVPGNGILAYYLYRGDEKKMTAFPPGFAMIAGDQSLRSDMGTEAQKRKSISFACLGSGKGETTSLPNYTCRDGLRAQVFFPSCWDGTNLGSLADKFGKHVAYPSGSSGNGKCPTTHPIRLPSIFIERVFQTGSLDWSQAKNPNQPFVFANGDATGFGYHGDFVSGWDKNILQKALDTCTNDSGRIEDCPVFKVQGDTKCRRSSQVNEVTFGVLAKLPGCNPVTTGPARAPVEACPNEPKLFPNPVAYNGDSPPAGTEEVAGVPTTSLKVGSYKYQGCYSDVQWTRVLSESLKVTGPMTVDKCIAACEAKKLKYCGPEWGKECFGGNTLGSASKPVTTCSDKCEGNANQICGGGLSLSLYIRSTTTKKMKRHSKRETGSFE